MTGHGPQDGHRILDPHLQNRGAVHADFGAALFRSIQPCYNVDNLSTQSRLGISCPVELTRNYGKRATGRYATTLSRCENSGYRLTNCGFMYDYNNTLISHHGCVKPARHCAGVHRTFAISSMSTARQRPEPAVLLFVMGPEGQDFCGGKVNDC